MSITDSATALVSEIRSILADARQRAVTAVNFAMVEAYWLMGKRIVEEEQKGALRAQYGESVMETLSKALTADRQCAQFQTVLSEVPGCWNSLHAV